MNCPNCGREKCDGIGLLPCSNRCHWENDSDCMRREIIPELQRELAAQKLATQYEARARAVFDVENTSLEERLAAVEPIVRNLLIAVGASEYCESDDIPKILLLMAEAADWLHLDAQGLAAIGEPKAASWLVENERNMKIITPSEKP